ncbi:MAG: Nucleotidyltransferase/DNA polymerase [Chthoniobacter sp.]|nr:Nucleotidyltransferase/DNA polymerase [Chthoniobacter sp.]
MFAAIHVPDFALQCVLRHEPELRSHALAVVDGRLPACVRQMTAAAREHGVAPGMTTTQALGRCPTLLFRTVGESLLGPASALLLQTAETFSPWLEATCEGVVTLEWRDETPGGKARHRGPLERAQEIVAQLASCDFAAQVAVAATPALALLAAHVAEPVAVVENAAEFLAPLPLGLLAADDEQARSEAEARERQEARDKTLRLLHRWGIHTLGAFSALPRDQVVTRLGVRGGDLWDRATGGAKRPLRLVRAPEHFAEAMELEHEVETLEPLLFILRRFLEQLAARLLASYRVASTLQLQLTFRGGAQHAREFRIPAPTAEVDVLFRILETHLETVTAEAPVIAVALIAQATRPEQKQFSLFETGLRDPNKFYETLGRLQALLGHDRVGTPVAEDTHRPDAFHLETPRFDEAANGSRMSIQPGPPLQRYRPPLPANVQVADNQPIRVFSEKAFGEITQRRGPWLGSGDWWTDRAWEREEWDVQVGEECYRLARQGSAWFIDGSYD